MNISLRAAWDQRDTAEYRVRALEAVLADRERELLELKGPCTSRTCRLHYAHSGPCAPPVPDLMANLRASLKRAQAAREPVPDTTDDVDRALARQDARRGIHRAVPDLAANLRASLERARAAREVRDPAVPDTDGGEKT